MSDLDNLDGLVQQADAGAIAADAPTEDQQQEQQGPDYMTEAAGAVEMFSALVVGYAPKAASVWTDGAKQRTAAALAPVMEKYGFTFGAMPPELVLIVTAGPLLWQSSKIVAEQMREERAQAEAERRAKAQRQAKPAANETPTKPGEPGQAPAVAVHPQMALYKDGQGA